MNHILFADDVMLFSKSKAHCVEHVEEVLQNFAKAMGLEPNLRKSKIIYSKSVCGAVISNSNFEEFLSVKYLGVPLLLKSLNKCHY